MKCIYHIYFFVILLAFVPNLLAAPVYGTKMPDKGHWFWGLEVNSLLDRDLERGNGGFESTQYFLAGSYGITDWLCFDGKIGAGNINYQQTDTGKIDFNTSFAGAYGFRVKVYNKEESPFKAVLGFQHISVHPQSSRLNDVKRRAIFDDWQVSLVSSYNNIKRFVPYLGVKVSRGDLIEWKDDLRNRKKSEDSKTLGVFIGANFYLTDRSWVDIEARFLDETAVSSAVVYAF